jgi:hypothetical protein
MPDASATYVFGGDAAELARLIVQAAGLAPQAQWLLDQIPIRAGWRTAGCGPIGILDLLSERVGPQGLVVALSAKRAFSPWPAPKPNVAGLATSGSWPAMPSIPTCRRARLTLSTSAWLMNMPQAQQRTMVSQMLALLKPGGSIALQDYDRVLRVLPRTSILGDFVQSPTPTPSVPAVATARRVLPWLLRSAGARNVKTKIHASFVDVGDSRRTHQLGLLAVMEDKILALGRFGRTEFAEHKQALLEHLAHPDTLLIDHLLVQAWGQAGRETRNRSFRANQRVRGFGRA